MNICKPKRKVNSYRDIFRDAVRSFKPALPRIRDGKKHVRGGGNSLNGNYILSLEGEEFKLKFNTFDKRRSRYLRSLEC